MSPFSLKSNKAMIRPATNDPAILPMEKRMGFVSAPK
jgi:hypothetical protein